jgi:hypothetical protein
MIRLAMSERLPQRAPWPDNYTTELIGFPGRETPSRLHHPALDDLREPDIAAEYLKAFGNENVLRFLARLPLRLAGTSLSASRFESLPLDQEVHASRHDFLGHRIAR